jgi:hypothetical protein
MMTQYLFGVYRIWGSHSGGGETPMSVYPVIEHFSRAEGFVIDDSASEDL